MDIDEMYEFKKEELYKLLNEFDNKYKDNIWNRYCFYERLVSEAYDLRRMADRYEEALKNYVNEL